MSLLSYPTLSAYRISTLFPYTTLFRSEIDVFGVVATEKKIQTPVAIVIEPESGVCVDPRRQFCLIGYAREALAGIVVEELGPAPLVNKKIFVTVVVVVAPNSTHRNAGAGLIHVGDPHLRRHILERSIFQVAVERVLTSLAAVGDVDVRPTVAIEIGDRYARAH